MKVGVLYVCVALHYFLVLMQFKGTQIQQQSRHAMPHSYPHYHNHSSVIEIEDE